MKNSDNIEALQHVYCRRHIQRAGHQPDYKSRTGHIAHHQPCLCPDVSSGLPAVFRLYRRMDVIFHFFIEKVSNPLEGWIPD